MTKKVYMVLVPLISLLLVSPIVGINQNMVENHSEFLAGDFDDISRNGDYEVSLEFAPGNEGISSVTRNEEIQNYFTVTNVGNLDDTYNLSVSWNDSYDREWHAEPDVDAVSVTAGDDVSISFTFRAPV